MGWPDGLYVDGNNTQANAVANELQVENTFMSGMGMNFNCTCRTDLVYR